MDSVTIVIPTRNRKEELLSTLETVVRADYENLEIVVFDNASTDGTTDAVRAAFSSDVRIEASAIPLAMAESFEAAYSKVGTDWVFGLGADDGLHASGISMMVEAAQTHDVEAVVPLRANYFWPGVLAKHPLGSLTVPNCALDRIRDSAEAVNTVLRGRENWMTLPTGYYGLVRTEVLHRHRARRGRLFNSPTPDLYLSFAVASETSRYVHLGTPVMIAGTSRGSTGLSQFGGDNAQPAEEFWRLNAASQVKTHPTFRRVSRALPSSIQMLEFEAFLQVQTRHATRLFVASRAVQAYLAIREVDRRGSPEEASTLRAWAKQFVATSPVEHLVWRAVLLSVGCARRSETARSRIKRLTRTFLRKTPSTQGAAFKKVSGIPDVAAAEGALRDLLSNAER